MAVAINSGPVEAADLVRHVPPERWRELMLARRRFCEINISYDCRCLVQFIDDAETMFRALGFSSAEDMVRQGYGLEPAEIDVAVEWLRLNPPPEPLPLSKARELGKQGGARPGAGRPKTGEVREPQDDNQGCVTTLKRGTKAHWLARLDRDGSTELAARVRAGELSANAAAIEAGFRRRPAPVEQVLKLMPKLTAGERREVWLKLDAEFGKSTA